MKGIHTARLRGERLKEEDYSLICAMHEDSQLMKTLGGVRSAEQSRQWLQSDLEHWQKYGYGIWIFYDHKGRFVGRCGLRNVTVEGRAEVEIAYAILPKYWGQGYATEMARKALEVAQELGIEEIVIFTWVENSASLRVIEKLGLTFEKELDYAGLPHRLYRFKRG